jgi:hypothetical protein
MGGRENVRESYNRRFALERLVAAFTYSSSGMLLLRDVVRSF